MSHCPLSIHCFLGEGHRPPCRDAGMTADGLCLDPAHLRLVMRDGAEVLLGRCPKCGSWCELDDEMANGHCSTHHDVDGCEWHETKHWLADHAS